MLPASEASGRYNSSLASVQEDFRERSNQEVAGQRFRQEQRELWVPEILTTSIPEILAI
jgi:hypothetical protein